MDEKENSEVTTGTEPETINNEPDQSSLQKEIEREKGKGEVRSEAEKAAYSLKKNAERVRELGLNPEDVLGIKPSKPAYESVDKDAPLTVGMYEQMQKDREQQTALQLADSIHDEYERTLVKEYIAKRIVPSGDAQEDLRFARLAVNSVKNSQVVEELNRGVQPRQFASGAGAPPKTVAPTPELTAGELLFTKAPFNMTAAEIIAKRQS